MLGKTDGKISEELDVRNWARRHDKCWWSGV